MNVWTKGQCPSNEKRSEDGAIEDDGYQSSNLTQLTLPVAAKQ